MLVSRKAYIRGGLYLGGLYSGFFGILVLDKRKLIRSSFSFSRMTVYAFLDSSSFFAPGKFYDTKFTDKSRGFKISTSLILKRF